MSAFYENYVKLCALHNLSESGAAKKIGLSNAAANGWKKGKMPSATTQVKLTDLFGVSVKELMGETDDPSVGIKKERPADGEALTDMQKTTIDLVKSMSDADLKLFLDILKTVRENSKRSE